MNEQQFLAHIRELGFRCTADGAGSHWIRAADGAEISMKFGGGCVHLCHVFADEPVDESPETLAYLLDLNGQLTVFKLALDERRTISLRCSWPLAPTTSSFAAFLVHEMFAAVAFLRENMLEQLAGQVQR